LKLERDKINLERKQKLDEIMIELNS